MSNLEKIYNKTTRRKHLKSNNRKLRTAACKRRRQSNHQENILLGWSQS